MPLRMPRRAGLLLRTGQTTSYGSGTGLDDGALQRGLPKRYEILTTGQYSGTTNIDMQGMATAATISFDAATKECRDSANGMAVFKTNDVVVITGSASNNGTFTVTTGNVAAKFTCSGAVFVDEAAGANITIKKREAKSNNCVLDLNTGLMWSRYVSLKHGSASTGALPWTTDAVGQGVFAYAGLCNAASLGGYADWCVPNVSEEASISDCEVPYGPPDSTAFPSWPIGLTWTSTTDLAADTDGMGWNYQISQAGSLPKTYATKVPLVRGGV